MSHLGEIAALGAAMCFVGSSLHLTTAGERVGSLPVNLIRLLIAIPLLSVWTFALRGYVLPTDASSSAWGWLSLSGLVGLTLGDLFLFRSFVLIGPRLATLVMCVAPPLAGVLSWWVLDETLDQIDIVGMALILVGVAVAVGVRRERSLNLVGLLFAFLGAAGQAGGMVLSKYGMGDYSAIASTQIRAIAGAGGFMVILGVAGYWPRVVAAMRDRIALRATFFGAIFGPVIGVVLSLYAVQQTDAGIAVSLMSLTPVFIIPFAMRRGEEVGVSGVAGALIAVAGVFVLFLG